MVYSLSFTFSRLKLARRAIYLYWISVFGTKHFQNFEQFTWLSDILQLFKSYPRLPYTILQCKWTYRVNRFDGSCSHVRKANKKSQDQPNIGVVHKIACKIDYNGCNYNEDESPLSSKPVSQHSRSQGSKQMTHKEHTLTNCFEVKVPVTDQVPSLHDSIL